MSSVPFCGIDVGTQGVRTVVLADDGIVLGSGRRSLPPGHRVQGRHEQSPDSWWEALTGATADAVRAAGGVTVDAVALDATSGTVLVEGPDGRPRTPALMYDDSRAAEQADRAQRVGAAQWDSLGYRMQTPWALPKAMWLMEQGEVRDGDRIAHQSDHLVRRLTGQPTATDTSSALKTGADLRTVAWPENVLHELGVPTSVLPDLVLPGTRLGVVSRDAAAVTGLAAGTPVRAGMTDGCAAQIAAGAVRPGDWSSALGTTLVVKGSTEELVRDPSGAVYCHRHPDGGWLPGGASNIGAGVLTRWFAGLDLDDLTAAAARVELPEAVVYPLDGRGERFPFRRDDAVAFGLEENLADATRFAAVCLGIAYVERLAYDVLGSLGADTEGTVAVTGGTSRNDWWNQLRADVLNRVVVVPAEPEAAVGMAVLAAAEPGRLSATTRGLVRRRAELAPDAGRCADLEAGYRRLVEALVGRGWLTAPPSRRPADGVPA